ncbi:MAG: FHA domain-containing protein, partial [Candidatus Hydrothermia bacterium]
MRLVVTSPDGTVKEHELNGDFIRIGTGNDVELSLPGLQPLEAIIRRRGDRFLIQPAENARVYMGDQRVLLPRIISPSDDIEVGSYIIRLETEATDAVPEPETKPAEETSAIKQDIQPDVDTTPTEFLELPPEI